MTLLKIIICISARIMEFKEDIDNELDQISAWIDEDFIDREQVYNIFKQIDTETGIKNIAPPLTKVFRAFKYFDPQQTKVIIIGQDPYYTPGTADGLCFSSSSDSKLPPSLKNIYLAADVKSTTADLRFWACQGVLMINTALTTKIGKDKEHVHIWKPFIIRLLKKLNKVTNKISVFAWGTPAKNLANTYLSSHDIMTYSHPSPMSDNRLSDENKFKNCDHFKKVPKIIWQPDPALFIFTDGSCTGNGTKEAVAGFAAILKYKDKILCKIHASVLPYCYKLKSSGIRVVKDKECIPTNNRGEYLAACYGLLAAKYYCLQKDIVVVTDSKLLYNTMTEWLKKWKKEDKIEEKANSDLIKILDKLSNKQVRWYHCRSHVEAPSDKKSMDYYIWEGNEEADKYAAKLKHDSSFYDYLYDRLKI